MGKFLLGFLLGFVLAGGCIPAKADVITEFGAGYKSFSTTSVVMLPECHHVVIDETRPNTPGLNYRGASCGGDNPVFIGWPFAWQSSFSDVWTVRAGWFHLSHWFDGGKDRELHMDCACVTATFNWTEWRRAKASR